MTALSADEIVVAAPEGQVDLHNAALLREEIIVALDSPESSGVVLDLTGIEFLDSAGIGILVGAQRRARGLGKSFRVQGAGRSVQRVLDLSGFRGI